MRTMSHGAVPGASEPRYELVDPPAASSEFEPDPGQRAVLGHSFGPLLVRGGPGTGKTEALIRAAAAKVRAGTDPSSVMVLGLRRHDTDYLRSRINALTAPHSAAEVGVFTFPALAFAILRSAAVADGRDEPRLLTAPEADTLIRSLLGGEDFGWPEALSEALRTYAFTQQLRDLVLRCGERGVDRRRLDALGRRFDRPEWVAAARFYERYVDTLAVQSVSSALYDSAEIVRAAAAELRRRPELCPPPEWVFVDDLQDATPAHADLLELLAAGGRGLVAAACPDEAVFGYQGGDREIVRDFPDRFAPFGGGEAPQVQLCEAHGVARAPLAATVALSRRLRGPDRDRRRGTGSTEAGSASVVHLPSPTREATFIADTLRRAHLLDGVPYRDMAVLVKSAASIPQLRRAMQHAGVPTRQAADDVPLPAHPTVRDLLRVVLLGRHPERLDEGAASGLLHSQFGGADPFEERRLRQELRRVAVAADDFSPSADLLVEALRDPAEIAALPEEEWAEPARRLSGLFEAARSGGGVTEVLWRVWEASRLGERLRRRALSGDRRAQRADAELDAVIALFDLAEDYEHKQPGAGVDVFCEHILNQELPGDFRSARAELGEAVTLATAHAAHGRRWAFVVVAGAQEGSWPNLRPRGSVLGAEALVDVLDGRSDVDAVAQLLDEERRLFYVACTRARTRLLVTAVDSDELQPSRFCSELGLEPSAPRGTRPLSLAALVARLREVVADPAHPDREAAAVQLKRLAAAGVPGADPSRWWGLAELSDQRALALAGETLRVSPSQVEKSRQCSLRWVLESHGGDSGDPLPRHLGTLLHAAAESVAEAPDADPAEVMERVVAEHFDRLPFEAPWQASQERARVEGAIGRFAKWLSANRRELLGAERSFRIKVELGPPEVEVVISGQVDRLERDRDGRLYVVDLKTGRREVSVKDVPTHPQLGTYQFAVAEGAFEEGSEPGGAELIYPNKDSKTVTTRSQGALGEAENPDWAREMIDEAARQMSGPVFEARHSSKCATCSVKSCCPITEEGRQVTDE